MHKKVGYLSAITKSFFGTNSFSRAITNTSKSYILCKKNHFLFF